MEDLIYEIVSGLGAESLDLAHRARHSGVTAPFTVKTSNVDTRMTIDVVVNEITATTCCDPQCTINGCIALDASEPAFRKGRKFMVVYNTATHKGTLQFCND